MHAPSKILVAVDFSEPSRAALDYAVALAASLGANVDVLHVWHPHEASTSRDEVLSDFARSDPGKAMMEWLAPLEQVCAVAARGRLALAERARVPETIVGVAEEGQYDLVVLGSDAKAGIARFLHGSVIQRVSRQAPCPVLTVRAEGAAVADVPEDDDPLRDVPFRWLS